MYSPMEGNNWGEGVSIGGEPPPARELAMMEPRRAT